MILFAAFHGQRDAWYIDDNTERAPCAAGPTTAVAVCPLGNRTAAASGLQIKHTYAHLHGVDVTLGFRRNCRGRVSSGGSGPSAYTEASRRAISRLSATVSAASASSSASILADSAASARCLASSRAANALRSVFSASYSSMSRATAASVGCAGGAAGGSPGEDSRGGVASRTRVGGDAPSAPPPSTSFHASEGHGVVGCSSRGGGPGGGGGGGASSSRLAFGIRTPLRCESLSVLALALALASAVAGSMARFSGAACTLHSSLYGVESFWAARARDESLRVMSQISVRSNNPPLRHCKRLDSPAGLDCVIPSMFVASCGLRVMWLVHTQ
jgi:hypothetical protein